MMRLDDLLQRLDDLDGDLNIFAVPPYAAESLAAVGSSAPDAFKLVCDVRSAKAMPTGNGLYRFMPFMGPGHYQLVEVLRRGDRLRCSMPSCSFTVIGIPEGNGRTLEIAEFALSS